MTIFPPSRSTSAIQAGIFNRWSTERAGVSSRAAQRIAGSPPGPATANWIPSIGGQPSAHRSRPRSRSWPRAVPNMAWLDMTRPPRMSSGVRLETTVTS